MACVMEQYIMNQFLRFLAYCRTAMAIRDILVFWRELLERDMVTSKSIGWFSSKTIIKIKCIVTIFCYILEEDIN